MFDIKSAPIETLLKDKTEAEESLKFGQQMWDRGIRKVDNISLESLMIIDKSVIAMIDAELERRAREQASDESS